MATVRYAGAAREIAEEAFIAGRARPRSADGRGPRCCRAAVDDDSVEEPDRRGIRAAPPFLEVADSAVDPAAFSPKESFRPRHGSVGYPERSEGSHAREASFRS